MKWLLQYYNIGVNINFKNIYKHKKKHTLLLSIVLRGELENVTPQLSPLSYKFPLAALVTY